jgi:DUF917 family protein
MNANDSRRSFLKNAALLGVGASAVPVLGAADGGASGPARRGELLLDRVAIEDILTGCAVLGCGGGGKYAEGLARVNDELEAGRAFRLLPVAELGDDEWVASPYGIGSLAPQSEEDRARFAGLPRAKEDNVEASFRRLSRFLNRPFVAVVAGELGPWSTAAALSTAARLGIPLLDADRVGRATPEATQDSVLVAGLSNLPLAAVSAFGDSLILEKVARDSRIEDLLRALSVASAGDLGVTDAALSGLEIRRSGALIVGTISKARALGQAVRQSVAAGTDPVAALLATVPGQRLFQGVVLECPWRDEAGFLVGEVLIEGRGEFAASRYRIRFKNENIVAWKDDAVSVLPPDLISVVDSGTAVAIANPEFEPGRLVTVLGFPAPPLWRTPAGLRVFGPAHFGLAEAYRPL